MLLDLPAEIKLEIFHQVAAYYRLSACLALSSTCKELFQLYSTYKHAILIDHVNAAYSDETLLYYRLLVILPSSRRFTDEEIDDMSEDGSEDRSDSDSEDSLDDEPGDSSDDDSEYYSEYDSEDVEPDVARHILATKKRVVREHIRGSIEMTVEEIMAVAQARQDVRHMVKKVLRLETIFGLIEEHGLYEVYRRIFELEEPGTGIELLKVGIQRCEYLGFAHNIDNFLDCIEPDIIFSIIDNHFSGRKLNIERDLNKYLQHLERPPPALGALNFGSSFDESQEDSDDISDNHQDNEMFLVITGFVENTLLDVFSNSSLIRGVQQKVREDMGLKCSTRQLARNVLRKCGIALLYFFYSTIHGTHSDEDMEVIVDSAFRSMSAIEVRKMAYVHYGINSPDNT